MLGDECVVRGTNLNRRVAGELMEQDSGWDGGAVHLT